MTFEEFTAKHKGGYNFTDAAKGFSERTVEVVDNTPTVTVTHFVLTQEGELKTVTVVYEVKGNMPTEQSRTFSEPLTVQDFEDTSVFYALEQELDKVCATRCANNATAQQVSESKSLSSVLK